MKTRTRKTSGSKKTSTSKSQSNQQLKSALLAANAAEEKKGENIVLLDVSKLTTIADYFLIVTAGSSSQIEAIAKNIEEELSKLNCKLVSKEGLVNSNWVVSDFGNVVVHVMREDVRNYYKLEKFWSNGVIVDKNQWKKAS